MCSYTRLDSCSMHGKPVRITTITWWPESLLSLLKYQGLKILTGGCYRVSKSHAIGLTHTCDAQVLKEKFTVAGTR